MLGRIDSLGDDEGQARRWPWLAQLAVAWVAGIVVGDLWPSRAGLLVVAVLALVMSALLLWRKLPKQAHVAGLIGFALVGGAWLVVQRDYVAAHDVSRVIHDEPALAQVRGTIASSPRDIHPDQGPFGSFNYASPGTLFELDVDAVNAGGGFEPATGAILVRIKQHDHRPRLGQRIEATGWLSAIGPTQNPGEFDYRAYLQEQGVAGRLTLMRRGNWRSLGPPPRYTFTGVRREIGDAAASSLRLGMADDPQLIGLLDALLLGRRTGDIDELSDSFRAVGLSHVLSISGAHLGILLLLVWALGRLLIGRPSVVTVLVLGVLVLFLLAVPWRTPIIRAAIMAGVFCFGYGLGRRLTGVEVLATATLIVLIWKPNDLFSAGFQLSFGVVGALLLFARPVSRWILPEPDVSVVHPSAWDLTLRWLVDFTAVSVVAFAVALPVVMHHFQLISPLAVLLSMLALPVLTALLGLGYLKIIVGLVSPAAGSLLAVPLAWASDSLAGLVTQAQRWPGASVVLWAQPSVAWTLAGVGVVVALFAGLFDRRFVQLGCCTLVLVGWAWVEQRPRSAMTRDDPPAVVVNMFAVGDGSCFLVRSGEEVLMFDCGSQGFWRIGERSIVPALKSIHVRRIDTLMLSHADLDHFVGVVDVVDSIQVVRVLVSPDVLREAERVPYGAAGFLVSALRERGYEPRPVERGWAERFGDCELELLWPAAGFESEKNNNNSLVLAVRGGGRVVLLNGDIQGEAIDELLKEPALLKADVTDLAHHGSFVDQSPAWIEAVDPRVALQSSGPRRPEQDRWGGLLEQRGVTRLRTNEFGMVQLEIDQDGTITWSTHRAEPDEQ
jgi:competence protein ComEC